MKILYAVQATGNGHISRAMEILPCLQQYGEVDIFLSGANSSLALNAPVKFRSKGLSLFYSCHGKLDYWKTAASFAPLRIRKEANELPVEKYDLILNDFEAITALACHYRKIPSVQFGHQASFMSEKSPRPERKNKLGEWVLKNYAPATHYIGLHFRCYDDFILPPVIRDEIQTAEPTVKNYFTVYLPAFCEHKLEKVFHALPEFQFQVFSGETRKEKSSRNIRFFPVHKDHFTESLIHCKGLITGAGFETPAEAIHLGKKLMVLPIKGQYEQQCNAAALEKMGVKKLDGLDENFTPIFLEWANNDQFPGLKFQMSTEQIVEKALKISKAEPLLPVEGVMQDEFPFMLQPRP